MLIFLPYYTNRLAASMYPGKYILSLLIRFQLLHGTLRHPVQVKKILRFTTISYASSFWLVTRFYFNFFICHGQCRVYDSHLNGTRKSRQRKRWSLPKDLIIYRIISFKGTRVGWKILAAESVGDNHGHTSLSVQMTAMLHFSKLPIYRWDRA